MFLHELGHALGLAHVDDDRQVMHPAGGAQLNTYGSGDLAGLHQLGAAPGCL